MNRWDLTDEEIVATAKGFSSRHEWYKANTLLYHVALRRGLLQKIWELLPAAPGKQRAYNDDELKTHAKRFETREAWRNEGELERLNGEPSHYGCALKRGRGFMAECCGHMPSLRGKHTPIKYSEEEIAASAAKYKHRNDWKLAEPRYYQAAHRRGLIAKVAGHMVPQAHPYSGSYIVYAFEFSDRCAYVGLTFLPRTRFAMHMQRGPVHDHIKVCPEYTYKVVEDGITGPDVVGAIERRWMANYKAAGWTPLWTAEGGGLGTVEVIKWTREAVLAEARKFTTKQEWIDGSQMSYRVAKREGWFEEAAAHMPSRKLGVGLGRTASAATRRRQRLAKLGRKQSAAHRQARSKAVKEWWAKRARG